MQGLCEGDVVCEFGSIKSDNFHSLQDIGRLVQHSQNVTTCVYACTLQATDSTDAIAYVASVASGIAGLETGSN